MKKSNSNSDFESNNELEILEEHEISQGSLDEDLKSLHNVLSDESWSFGQDLARLSLLLGVSQFFLFWLLIPGPAAILFGYKSLRLLKKGEKGQAKAWIGLLLGCLGVVVFLAFFIWLYVETLAVV